MVKILLFLLVIGLIGFVAFNVITIDNQHMDGEDKYKLHYGPIDIGFNETHFRLYGEHVLEVEE